MLLVVPSYIHYRAFAQVIIFESRPEESCYIDIELLLDNTSMAPWVQFIGKMERKKRELENRDNQSENETVKFKISEVKQLWIV